MKKKREDKLRRALKSVDCRLYFSHDVRKDSVSVWFDGYASGYRAAKREKTKVRQRRERK